MTVTTRAEKPESLFGMSNAFQLGAIILVGFVLVALLSSGHSSLLAQNKDAVAKQNSAVIGNILWGVEVALYFAIAWRISMKKPIIGLTGVLFGIIGRVLLGLVTALIYNMMNAGNHSDWFTAMSADFWLLRCICIMMVAGALFLPCRKLIQSGFAIFHADGTVEHPSSSKQFSFNTTRASQPGHPEKRQSAETPRHQQDSVLLPPDGFTPIKPQEDVLGMVNIPVEVIITSVPEAQAFLSSDQPVRVRLAYLTPQLHSPTVWLTWQQIFHSGADDLNYRHGGQKRPDVDFNGRWICIPPKYYVQSVPREYFAEANLAQPAWLKRPAVPQEAQFEAVVQ